MSHVAVPAPPAVDPTGRLDVGDSLTEALQGSVCQAHCIDRGTDFVVLHGDLRTAVGNHVARLYEIIHLGTVPTSWQGQER
jgi:hypothetical protein